MIIIITTNFFLLQSSLRKWNLGFSSAHKLKVKLFSREVFKNGNKGKTNGVHCSGGCFHYKIRPLFLICGPFKFPQKYFNTDFTCSFKLYKNIPKESLSGALCSFKSTVFQHSSVFLLHKNRVIL